MADGLRSVSAALQDELAELSPSPATHLLQHAAHASAHRVRASAGLGAGALLEARASLERPVGSRRAGSPTGRARASSTAALRRSLWQG
jgi:hypothetical protein